MAFPRNEIVSFDLDRKLKSLGVIFGVKNLVVRACISLSLPWGMQFDESPDVPFMGSCWFWTEYPESFCEHRLVWFGCFSFCWGFIEWVK